MITVLQIINALQASELRDHAIGTEALKDLKLMNQLITLINLATEELNKDLMLNRQVYPLMYHPDCDRYCVPVEDLEKILGVYDCYGNAFALNDAVPIAQAENTFNTVGSSQPQGYLVAQTETYSTLYFPYKLNSQRLHVLCRTAFKDLPHALGLEDACQFRIPMPKAFLEAIVAYVSYKISKGFSPSREGNQNSSIDHNVLYDKAVQKLKAQGYANDLMFTTDGLFRNSTFI